MPWNGNGTTSLTYNWEQDAANGVNIRADKMDTQESDIASMIQNCITRDGQASPQANISWASFKITNLANGSASTDAVNYGQVFSSGSFADPTFTGTVTATGATAVNVPTPGAGDNSTKAANTGYLVTYYAPLASPALTGTPTAPTATVGTNTTQIATTAFVQSQAFSTALPVQTGNSGKFVTTNGTTASWSLVPLGSSVSGTLPIANGGTGQTSANAALNALLPTQTSNSGKVLTTNGTDSSWGTMALSKVYESTGQTITSAGTLTLAHGLGVQPKLYETFLQCTTANQGYSIGDVTPVAMAATWTTVNTGVSITADTTNIYITFGSNAGVFLVTNKSSGAAGAITNGSWNFIVRAYA